MRATRIESLEARNMLSATVVGSVLTIRGTPGDDAIHVHLVSDEATGTTGFAVSGDGVASRDLIPADGIKRIVVLPGNGNDVVDLNLATYTVDAAVNASRVTIPALINGGRGNDKLLGGSVRDIIVGGAGNDSLGGNGGDDRVTGGAGADVFYSVDGDSERRDFNTRRGDQIGELPALVIETTEPDPLTTVPEPIARQTIDAGGKFTFQGPVDLIAVPVQAYDSLVGKYVNSEFEVTYDYGWYSGNPSSAETTQHAVNFGGKDAILVEGDGFVAVHFPQVLGMDKLTMVVKIADGATGNAVAILHSIKFAELPY